MGASSQREISSEEHVHFCSRSAPVQLGFMSAGEELFLQRPGPQEDDELAIYLQDLFRDFDTAVVSP